MVIGSVGLWGFPTSSSQSHVESLPFLGLSNVAVPLTLLDRNLRGNYHQHSCKPTSRQDRSLSWNVLFFVSSASAQVLLSSTAGWKSTWQLDFNGPWLQQGVRHQGKCGAVMSTFQISSCIHLLRWKVVLAGRQIQRNRLVYMHKREF